MEKYKRYYGLMIFVATVLIASYISYNMISPKLQELESSKVQIEKQERILKDKKQKEAVVRNKIKKIKDSITGSQKKIYSPVDSDLGNDTIFFTLYNDLLEMIHANSVRIKAINYEYNPKDDEFVKFGKDVYFVCDVNLELVSNYTNLGKLIQNIYQYPYYIKMNNIEVKPYAKDKKVLVTNMSLRLYAHTEPNE